MPGGFSGGMAREVLSLKPLTSPPSRPQQHSSTHGPRAGHAPERRTRSDKADRAAHVENTLCLAADRGGFVRQRIDDIEQRIAYANRVANVRPVHQNPADRCIELLAAGERCRWRKQLRKRLRLTATRFAVRQ